MPDKDIENINDKVIENLLYYYEIKMQGLGSYSNIVWNRFNWFLTLELALAGFLFTQGASSPDHNLLVRVIWFFGGVVSTFWLTLGIMDYFSLKRYSDRVRVLNDTIADTLVSRLRSLKSRDIHDKSLFTQTKILFILPGLLFLCWGIAGYLLLMS